jgi:branched-chain amino acid transport system ATP-binding protein
MSLRVEDVTLRFGGVSALSGVSFEAGLDQITSLIGPNGAGKTTLFNVVTGFLRPLRGSVVYEGESIVGLRPFQVARRGLVRTFQKTSIFPQVTVFENVMIGLHMEGTAGIVDVLRGGRKVNDEEGRLRVRAHEIVELVGLGHRQGHLAGSLPYGEQRILEVAIALGARPRLLLLDEPAAGLNTGERQSLIQLINRIREQGITVLLVEHDMRLVMGISDQVVCLDHGQVIAHGSPSEVQSHPDVIRAYLGSA